MTEILILDYNRPAELKVLLESIKTYCLFGRKVVVLNNGGEKYADEYLAEGLCDEVIHNSINIGCGAGTVQLFSQCQSDYAFYIQVDHELVVTLNDAHIEMMENIIKSDFSYVDLAGDQGHGKYSERAQFIGRDFYLSIPKSFNGPGPLDADPWTEECVQNFLVDKGLTFYTLTTQNGMPPFIDAGKKSVRSNPDGSEWLHYPDTKVVWCLRQPTEKFKYPPLNKEEWKLALDGKWPEKGLIIEEWKDLSFEHWNKFDDRPAIPCNLIDEEN